MSRSQHTAMPKLLSILSLCLVSLVGVLYQAYLAPALKVHNFFLSVETQNRPEQCTTYPELQGCEKIVLLPDSGLLYLSCSSLEQREHWLNPSPAMVSIEGSNYLAIYTPGHNGTGAIQHISLEGLDTSRTIAFHGLDVVPSNTNKTEIFIYLVHHRLPKSQNVLSVGYDSCIEVFKAKVGGTVAVYLHTLKGDALHSPNDVVGQPDGKGAFFTNDGKIGSKAGTLIAHLQELVRPTSSVAYCHVDNGCKTSIGRLRGPNGITMASNGTIYVASSLWKNLMVLERQYDDSLVQTDTIPTESITDNISIDEDGIIWAASIPNSHKAVEGMKNVSRRCPHATIRAGLNDVPSSESRHGRKYKVETVLQDDGDLLSFITSVVHDSRRERLYLHGLTTPWLTVCELPRL